MNRENNNNFESEKNNNLESEFVDKGSSSDLSSDQSFFENKEKTNNTKDDFETSENFSYYGEMNQENQNSQMNDNNNMINIKEVEEVGKMDLEPDFERFNFKENFKEYKNIFADNEFAKSEKRDFEWDYEKYRKIDQLSRGQSSKKRGAKIFALTIASLLLVSAVSFFGFELSGLTANFFQEQISLDNQETRESRKETLSTNNAAVSNNVFQNVASVESTSATYIAQKVIPSVVSITTYERYQSFYQMGMTDTGGGSGIIISGDGLIATNAHVVLNLSTFQFVDAVKVTLSDGKEYEAQIKACDIDSDIAIIKISGNNLPVAEFGNSDNLKIGETVYAVGSPASLNVISFTSGVISAINVTAESNLTVGNANKYIMTDAAINPGNSGGPLVNQNGQIVGINSRKLSGLSIEGIGFTIPINHARSIIKDLIEHGYVQGKVKLGIRVMKEIDEITARLNNIKTGLLIDSVEENSDLASKGIQKYDILHKINNIEIFSVQELKERLKNFRPGDSVELTFLRLDQSNKVQEFKVNAKLMEDKGIFNLK